MTAREILDAFSTRSALVVGDICLDRWCTYDPNLAEPSRETGITRLAVVSTDVTPGAGGTVANNLAALGVGRLAIMGVIGDDGHAYELTRALNQRGISPELLIRAESMPTFTYTKLINSNTGVEDQPRVDFVHKPLPPDVEKQVIDNLLTFASAFDVIFVSDQAETRRGGVVTAAVRNAIARIARENPKQVILADSRIRGELFRKVVLKCNQQEADSASTGLFSEVNYQKLRQTVESELLLVTQGANGVMVVEPGKQTLVPGRKVQPVDICGAGDSFSAGAGVALAITGSAMEAARFGNLVASITVTKKGTGCATPDEVLAVESELALSED